ncbi:MAG: molecular chaperone DnaJ [Candidatus Marinimicrobia bacterium]|jgi:molecular chaperone DnaJ|nr:molecular chaperone DnaJ [Candidatus Neomarinimicrobiota bacterium]MBT3675886.1 molecular chaperone DnaJ [Candidatus Neomarinimicrobiota bacterium]MBT3763465.1 molecular chaperone DnaJ [Candidatus Neomarinimicrobiota bacterium]MBT4068553.1 molecular chaperone DnaJ [Candidatus Neomarinimicrobiota bacterium]MBT4271581.1 molecular chaperone DnaJ [Candidatus Neomarinimicrobiota bacterium]
MRDLYDIIGVDKSASDNEIKKSYRKIAMKYHPDKNPGDSEAEQNFKEAAEAYSILSDNQKRRQYDQFGHAGVGMGDSPGGGTGFHGHMSMEDIFSSFGDIFGGGGGSGGFDPFGGIFGGGQRRGIKKARDLKVALKLDYADIVKGTDKTIKIKRHETCETCTGNGAQAGTMPTSCRQCSGSGQIRQMSQSFFGQSVTVRECPVCQGSGEMIENPCKPCGGNGIQRKTVEIKVKVPAGVAEGNYMTLNSQGNKGPKGFQSGDLIIIFEEKEHPVFTRNGEDVITEVQIQFHQAALGITLEVPTLEGKANLKVPSGIQSGQILRMRGKGFPRVRGSARGDQLVRVQVQTPKSLSRQQKKILEELSSLNGQSEPIFKRVVLD